MATLALGVVGSVIGKAIGGTFMGMAAQTLGWNIGLTVGGMLFGPKGQDQQFEGPRLSDLKVQASTYGNPIPTVYGAARIAGNMIWSKEITETAHTSTQSSGGGKGGGGGSSVTTTTYTYSQSFAVALCEGEIAGVRKIWANGTLIYNLDADADIASLVASQAIAEGITVYPGSETQEADPLIEADVGTANAPAFRGTAYVVFEDLQLADYGNRAPNLEFEVVAGGSVSFATESVAVSGVGGGFSGLAYGNGKYLACAYDLKSYSSVDGESFSAVGTTPGAPLPLVDLGFSGGYFYAQNIVSDGNAQSLYHTTNGLSWALVSGSGVNYTCRYCIGNGGVYLIRKPTAGTAGEILFGTAAGVAKIAGYYGYNPTKDMGLAAGDGMLVYSDSLGNGGGYTSNLITLKSGVWYTFDFADGISPATNVLSIEYGNGVFFALGYGSGNMHVRVSQDGVVWSAVTTIAATPDSSSKRAVRFGNGYFVVRASASGVEKLYAFSAAGDLVAEAAFSVGTHFVYPFGPRGFPTSTGTTLTYNYPAAITATSTDLDATVTDICERAGLAAADIDVTGLSGTIGGYVTQQSTARSQLEQLATAYYFDAVESDGKVKFIPRGNASAASIDEDDLAAQLGDRSIADPLRISRQQELELPVEVTVQHFDSAAGYAIGSQRSQRLITDSLNKQSINLAISCDVDKAKQIAEVLMFSAWTARTRFEFSTGWKWCWLEPTDVIDVTSGGRTYTLRITSEDYAGTSQRRAVLDDAEVYSSTATGVPALAVDESVLTTPLTRLELLDIPLLRDVDDGVGFYAAGCGYGSGWAGAQIFKSLDGGATWSSFGNALLHEAAIGDATTALGAFTQNIFDETNSVTVVMTRGTLASATELQVLNGANAAILGDEVIQFRDATLTAESTYKLTGLLRGRLGTEWAASTHAVGDRFVMIDEDTTRVMPGASGEYDLDRDYRGVSFGTILDDAYTETFANTAVARIPYAPVLIGGGRNAAGDLTINWTRRTRISGGWNSYSDVPLGEDSESYEIDIYSSGTYATVLRTITATSQTASYTAAQQTTDFGSPQATIYVGVFQMSASVGRGYELRGAI